MAMPLRPATGGMKVLSWILLLFIAELIMETGIQLKSLLTIGLSVKNAVLLGFALYVFFKSNASLNWAGTLGLRKISLLYLVLALYSGISLSFPALLDIPDYNLLLAATSYKNEMLDAFLCMIIFAYFASRPGLGLTMLQGVLVVIGIAALLTFLDATIIGGKLFGFTANTMRTKGAMGEPNQTAAIFAMYVPIGAGLVLAGQRVLLNLALLGCLLIAILVTGSRGGMVAASVSLMATLFLCRNYISIQRKMMFAIVAPLVGMLIFALLPTYYKDLIYERFFFGAKKSVSMRELSAGRTLIWEYAVDYWLRSPIIGSGWYGFVATTKLATHNTFVEYVVSIGVVGLSILLYLWYTVFSVFRRFARLTYLPKSIKVMALGCAGGVVGIMTAIFFVNLYKPWLFVWIGTGTALGYLTVTAALYRQQAIGRMQQMELQQDIASKPETDTTPPQAGPRLGYLRAKEGL